MFYFSNTSIALFLTYFNSYEVAVKHSFTTFEGFTADVLCTHSRLKESKTLINHLFRGFHLKVYRKWRRWISLFFCDILLFMTSRNPWQKELDHNLHKRKYSTLFYVSELCAKIRPISLWLYICKRFKYFGIFHIFFHRQTEERTLRMSLIGNVRTQDVNFHFNSK